MSSKPVTLAPITLAVSWTGASLTQLTFSLFNNLILRNNDLEILGLVSVMFLTNSC